MNECVSLSMAGLTHPGMVRRDNQDNFFVDHIGGEGQVLAVVADGVGGYAGGEEAARLAVTLMPEYLGHKTLDIYSFGQAVRNTHNAIYERRFANPAWTNMCCVWTAVLFDTTDGCLHFFHLGDTRFYAYDGGNRLIKLSHDHSYVGQLEEKGILTEAQAMSHKNRSVIDRVAADFPLQSDSQYYQKATLPMVSGITYLLCSDGLTDMITSAEISEILSAPTSVQERTQTLVDAANRAGGRDNITVVLVEGYTPSDPENQKQSDTSAVMNCYADYTRTR